ncbi:MAG: hypothetical protein KGL44_11785 [Sphingomonadales bacterium]|nr:hypothetical protein [Sphingomonadales bacterium]
MQRMGGFEEVAAASLFLVSDDASYVNGLETLVGGCRIVGAYSQATRASDSGQNSRRLPPLTGQAGWY